MSELPACRFRRTHTAETIECACPKVHAPGGRVASDTCLRCPWRLPEEGDADEAATAPPRDRGLGDTVARWTKALGVRPCAGCRKRQAWLNRWVPYGSSNDAQGEPAAERISAALKRTIAVVPVFGETELTHQLLRDIAREGVDVLIVDNGGNFPQQGNEWVLRPGENLGWLRGNNLGIQTALATGRYDRVVLLNNDLRLSRGFFAGLIEAELATGASIVAASYDGHWAIQNPEGVTAGSGPPAELYQPRAEHLPHGACDGTCVSVHARVVERAGLLDADSFGRYGWWAMTDWCIRAKQAGLTVAITRAAYCNHLGQRTGRRVHGDRYAALAQREAVASRAAKWGVRWKDLQNAWTLVPLTVYTAITGGRDRLKDPPIRPAGVRWVAFVDDASCAAGCTAGARAWEVVPLHKALGVPRSELPADPRRSYKPVKCCPQAYLAGERSISVDASFLVRGDVRQLAWYLGSDTLPAERAIDLAMFDRGADRRVDCIYEEGRRCLLTDLDLAEVIETQLARYRRLGHPEHWGLSWTGCLVRRHTERIAELGQRWLDEIVHGSKRDQLSMMPSLRQLQIPWRWIPGPIRNNAWLLQDRHRPQRPGLHDAPAYRAIAHPS